MGWGRGVQAPAMWESAWSSSLTFLACVPFKEATCGGGGDNRGNNFISFKDFYLKAKAKIWPRLSYLCQAPIRSTAEDGIAGLGVFLEIAVQDAGFRTQGSEFTG